MDELREVIDEAVHVILPIGRPGAVAMAAQVGRDDMIAVRQSFGDTVPASAMVATAVDEQQPRRRLVPPIGIMQLQSLRDEAVRNRAAWHIDVLASDLIYKCDTHRNDTPGSSLEERGACRK